MGCQSIVRSTSEYMKDHIFELQRYEEMIDRRSYAHNLSSYEIKA